MNTSPTWVGTVYSENQFTGRNFVSITILHQMETLKIHFFFCHPKQPNPGHLIYSLSEHEFQQVVSVLPETFPVLSHCSISCFFSLLGRGYSGLPDALAQYVCHDNLLCYLNMNKHLIPNLFFPSPLEVHIKCHLDSSGSITRAEPQCDLMLPLGRKQLPCPAPEGGKEKPCPFQRKNF